MQRDLVAFPEEGESKAIWKEIGRPIKSDLTEVHLSAQDHNRFGSIFLPFRLLCAFAVLFCLSSQPASGFEGADPAVEKIEKAYQGLKDIRGNFVQKSFIKDFDRTDTFKGTFLMKMPSRMRWQYSGGDKQNTEVVINNDEMIIYQKQDKQAFKSRFDREIYGQAPIALLSGFSDIGKEFEITKKDGRLLLKPKRPMGNVLSLAITPSDKDFPIASLTIFDKRSNRIDITFTDVTVNTGIPESAFDFSLPKGASVYDYK
ncbi:MAG TPA: outer membrane lipoprotein carrier protein LolA [Thermodesulfovibrionales bacterium]|nr:outer membrane lipoprotein carrier protein LolA [Thermodesulfovibrionales bacterium]